MSVLSNSDQAFPVSGAPAVKSVRVRDRRLDFFRGLAMFIIFIAHMPGNWWINWIPARFGFSDATEIFVFCSGMASAIAFGSILQTRGLGLGAARVLYRVWQVYWAHIALFLAIAFVHIAADKLLYKEDHYVLLLDLNIFFDHVRDGVFGLITLTYVPSYFDILPMYLGILLMLPVMFALMRVSVYLAMAASLTLWALANLHYLELPADPWGDRGWFFNPFAWQLVFFTGFAIMRGQLKPPRIDKRLLVVAAAFLAFSIPLSWHKLVFNVPTLEAAYHALAPLTDKSHFGILRYVHFLALAYIANAVVVELGPKFSGRFVDIVRKVGQQSLGVFLASLVLAQIAAIVLDVTGRSYATVAIANLAGFAGLIAVARVVAWFKSSPWKDTPPTKAAMTADKAASRTAPAPQLYSETFSR